MMNFACLCSVCLLALYGCKSAPVHFYTLSPPLAKTSSALPHEIDLKVTVARIPLQNDRRELVVRIGAGELMLLENEQWASPLGNEIRDAVRLELSETLTQSDPSMAGLPRKVLVTIDVQRLEAALGQYGSMTAAWTIQASGGVALPIEFSCSFQANQLALGGPEGVVHAYQAVVSGLAKEIATQLKASLREGRAVCSTKV